jgi:hypothetical protein
MIFYYRPSYDDYDDSNDGVEIDSFYSYYSSFLLSYIHSILHCSFSYSSLYDMLLLSVSLTDFVFIY